MKNTFNNRRLLASLNCVTLLQILFCVIVCSDESFKCPKLLNKLGNENCENLNCGNAISRPDCPSNTIFIDNFALCKCCPSCVRFLHPDEPDNDDAFPNCVPNESADVKWILDPNCDDKDDVCPVRVNTCLPGFRCNTTSGICDWPEKTIPKNKETEECMFRKSLRQLQFEPPFVHWDPTCEADGSFSPKQCKGSEFGGECYCVDREGNRIFGREWRVNAENQTCECSRRTHELRNQGLTATIHCAPDGNFEALQCDTDSGLCYCVDPQTGVLDGAVIPESQWKSLPCFSLNVTNNNTDGKYLRKCESEYAALRQLKIIGKEHGLEVKTINMNCDFDGSFAPVRSDSTRLECVFKNGTRIRDFFRQQTDNMTCNCARDRYQYLEEQKRSFSYDCEQRTGNYEIVYDFGSNSSCVDRDGYLFGDIVTSEYYCCLMDDGCSPMVGNECFRSGGPHRACNYWWYNY